MNEQVDNIEYEFLWKLLANPADPNHSYIFSLQSLVTDFPQSGALRALLMPNGDRRHLKHAAAYCDAGVLYKLTTAPDSLPIVTAEQVVYSDEQPIRISANAYFNPPVEEDFLPQLNDDAGPVAEPIHASIDTFTEEEIVAGPEQPNDLETAYHKFTEDKKSIESYPTHIEEPGPVTDTEEAHTNIEAEPYAYPAEENADIHEGDDSIQSEAIETTFSISENDVYEAETVSPQEEEAPADEEENSLAKEYNEYIAKNDIVTEDLVSSYEDVRYFHQPIEDEVYDEIVSIEDIGLEQLAIQDKSTKEVGKSEEITTTAQENYFIVEAEIVEAVNNLHHTVAQERPALQTGSTNNLSRYNDEKMPYTFMWWLDKTRKEHADIYQPYISKSTPAVVKAREENVVDELQQQYYEHIVNTSSIDELETAPKPAPAKSTRKENKIIERFIKEEPQIKHPAGIKLDNENKAKSSAEDKEELVTETLARIYTEQMLFHKAIVTYKKLMLKFPEKSLYFAGQIEQLERKIN